MDKQRLEARYKAYRDYKAEGHSLPEVAEHFGISKATAQKVCKGIARQNRHILTNEERTKNVQSSLKAREANAIETINTYCSGFEYVDGYTNTNCYVRLRHCKCGCVDSYSYTTIRKKGQIFCRFCKDAERNAKKAEEKRITDQQREQKKRDKESERFLNTFLVICVECGKLFKTSRSNQVCCSPKCTKHRQYTRKDKRIAKDKRIDRGITVKALYKRDNGICWICGGKCDLNDYKKVKKTKVCGNNYPSVDHIVPVCEGGEDAWNNVRLAHRLCNSLRYSHRRDAPLCAPYPARAQSGL